LQGAGRTALFAHIAVFAFGTELVPLNGWKTAGGGGRGLALRRLLPLAEEQVRALAVCHQQQQQQQQQQQSGNKRACTDDNETAVDVESSNSKAAATRSTRTASRSSISREGAGEEDSINLLCVAAPVACVAAKAQATATALLLRPTRTGRLQEGRAGCPWIE
jgi:hypothetical protein